MIAFWGCNTSDLNDVSNEAYIKEVQEWHKSRVERLTSTDSWLSLAGLFWIKESENSFGSHESNDFIFPRGKSPDFMGKFILKADQVSVEIRDDVKVYYKEKSIKNMILKSDVEGEPTLLRFGSLSWYLIKRDGSFAVRLRDSENPNINSFQGIEIYPIDPKWKIKAEFEKYDPPREILTPTIMGTIAKQPSPGVLVFKVDGKECRLEAIGKPDSKRYFMIFADETNGKETYGAGKYVYIDSPSEDGTTIIDFNKSYNPPCAFTDYATCSFPSEENRLSVKITAGEKAYHSSTY